MTFGPTEGTVQVDLSSDHPNVISVPASVSFSGLQYVQNISTTQVSLDTPVVITAQYGGKQVQATIVIQRERRVQPIPSPIPVGVLFPPSLESVILGATTGLPSGQPSASATPGGAPLALYLIMINPTGATASVQVYLSSDHPSVISVPASVSFTLSGTQFTYPLDISSTPVVTSTSVVITAEYEGNQVQATIEVLAAFLRKVLFNPTSVTGGAASQGILDVTWGAPPGGMRVILSSSNPNVVQVPQSVLIPALSKTATFLATTKTVSSSTEVTITATYSSPSVVADSPSAQLTVQPVAVGAPLLQVESVSLYVDGKSITGNPSAAEPFQMCVNVANNGTGVADASTLTVIESAGGININTFSVDVPTLAPGATLATGPGTGNCIIQVLTFNSDVTYDFNIFDQFGNWLFDATYEM